jgi:hypothetical protein
MSIDFNDSTENLYEMYKVDVTTHQLFYNTIREVKQEMRNDPFYHNGEGLDLTRMTDEEKDNMYNFHFVTESTSARYAGFELFENYLKLRRQYFIKQRYTSFSVYNEFTYALKNLIVNDVIRRARQYVYCTNLNYYDKFYKTYARQPLSLQEIAGKVIRSKVQPDDIFQLPLPVEIMKRLYDDYPT